jgi:hypothetical protein
VNPMSAMHRARNVMLMAAAAGGADSMRLQRSAEDLKNARAAVVELVKVAVAIELELRSHAPVKPYSCYSFRRAPHTERPRAALARFGGEG